MYERQTDLSWNTSRDDNNLDALESLVQLVGGISLNLTNCSAFGHSQDRTISYLTRSVDVANISGDARCTADIIQIEGGDQRVAFQ